MLQNIELQTWIWFSIKFLEQEIIEVGQLLRLGRVIISLHTLEGYKLLHLFGKNAVKIDYLVHDDTPGHGKAACCNVCVSVLE